MKRAILFVDYKNIIYSEYKIDLFQIPHVIQDHLFNILGTEIDIVKTCVFINHSSARKYEGFVNAMIKEHFEVIPHSHADKNMDVSIACKMVSLAHFNAYDIAILLSGSSDLHPAIREVRDLGKRVMMSCFEDRISTIYKEPNHSAGSLDFDIFYLDKVLSAIASANDYDNITAESILKEINNDFFDGNVDYDNIRMKRYIAYWATRARFLQNEDLQEDDKETIKMMFDQLNKLSSEYKPGYIKALNKEWSPSSWKDEIRRIPRTW